MAMCVYDSFTGHYKCIINERIIQEYPRRKSKQESLLVEDLSAVS